MLKYDAGSQSVVAIVKKSEGKDEQATHELQTWIYDAAGNVWKRMNPEREPDPQLGFLWGGLTMGMLLSVPMIAAGVLIVLWAMRRPRRAAGVA